jgi:hypothetical protein
MADWVDGYHEIEVSHFKDDDGKWEGEVWMDEDTMHVEMSFQPPFPLNWVPHLNLADEADDG